MLKTSRPKRIEVPGMATTAIAFKSDDCVAVLEALDIRKMPRIWSLSDLTVLLVSGQAGPKGRALQARGISFNYASYGNNTAMSPAQAGQCRYGPDGEVFFINLVPDPQLAALYNKHLPGEQSLDDVNRMRICFVCCGQDSWDNREENGEMHKMRLLLT